MDRFMWTTTEQCQSVASQACVARSHFAEDPIISYHTDCCYSISSETGAFSSCWRGLFWDCHFVNWSIPKLLLFHRAQVSCSCLFYSIMPKILVVVPSSLRAVSCFAQDYYSILPEIHSILPKTIIPSCLRMGTFVFCLAQDSFHRGQSYRYSIQTNTSDSILCNSVTSHQCCARMRPFIHSSCLFSCEHWCASLRDTFPSDSSARPSPWDIYFLQTVCQTKSLYRKSWLSSQAIPSKAQTFNSLQ